MAPRSRSQPRSPSLARNVLHSNGSVPTVRLPCDCRTCALESIAHARRVHSSMNPPSLRRPEWLLSALLDGGLAVAAYLARVLAQVPRRTARAFLPSALSTMPLVVAGQLAALYVAGAYARRPRIDWQLRVVAGAVGGTIASAILVGVIRSFEGVSRSAFGADARSVVGWRSRLASRVGAAIAAPRRGARGARRPTAWSIGPRKRPPCAPSSRASTATGSC